MLPTSLSEELRTARWACELCCVKVASLACTVGTHQLVTQFWVHVKC